MKAVTVRIKGKVQGVWFRESTKEQAVRFGVTGWIRNLVDGDVEGHFEGPAAAVDRLLEWCQQGPPTAHVVHVGVEPAEPQGSARFEVRS